MPLEEKILAAFSNPGFYPHEVRTIRRVETHTAWVFLTGERAYKIKKPVNFGFLDFSTLDRRKTFCEREVQLNSEISDLYLGVEPITMDEKDNLKLGENGEVVEYAVVMKELPQEAMMSHLLAEDKVGYGVIDKLAKETARFHRKARTSDEITKEGSLDSVRFNWEENFSQTEDVKDVTISSEDFRFIRERIERFLREKEPAFRKRERDGYIRYCHGDLHSGNIFVHKGKIHIFDRIEFNLRFACSDTAADLAFMTMDLDFHRKRNLSDFLLDRYLDHTADYELLRFHDFFRCYRAYVRGKVIGFQLAQNPADPEAIKSRARAYFDLAKLYASTLSSKPQLIVSYGLPGTGKSLMASRTRNWTNAIHIRSDIVRRLLAGASLDEHHYASFGKDLYSSEMSNRVYEALKDKARTYLAQNQSLIIDATYSKQKERAELKEVGEKLEAEVHFIRCEAPDEKVREWIEQRKTSDKQSDATWEIYSKMKDKFEPEGKLPYHALRTGRDPREMDADVRRFLSR
jgi:aminoglycoside phosphotransferase family enzyme/predicted kinase